MVNIEKIKALAKEQGISITYLCESVGQKPYYFHDVKKRKGDIPDDRLEIIANILNTTKEYLRDEKEATNFESIFWENYVRFCREKGTSPNRVAAEIGLSSGSVTAWKNGALPRNTALMKISQYFGVSVKDLFGKEKKPTAEGGGVKTEELMNLAEKLDEDEYESLLKIVRTMVKNKE